MGTYTNCINIKDHNNINTKDDNNMYKLRTLWYMLQQYNMKYTLKNSNIEERDGQ